MNDFLFYGGALLVAGYILRIWLADLRAYRQRAAPASGDTPQESGDKQPVFPGATPVGAIAIVIAVAGAAVLLAVETIGEHRLGVSEKQTNMAFMFGLYTLAAAFIEELIFRGYLYYDRGPRWQLVASIIGVSLVFAALHPYMWNWTMPKEASSWELWRGRLAIDWGPKAIFSTAIVFARSLWFYTLRFWPANPLKSLLPPIAAHLATNLGVWAIKAAQGHVVWW
ncbi:MAG: CPBP family intramembrane metalloprotease [Planctomycetia bacterium]|nr:CPBP family intramembrane metalloprotease [Planctomycetia bacterium]